MKIRRTRWVWPVAFAALTFAAVGCGVNSAEGEGKTGAAGDANVAARIGDQVITYQELDEAVRQANAQAYQQYFDVRKQVLDNMIAQRLIDAEVAKRGIDQTQLQQEVTQSLAPVTDEEVQAFYNQSQARMGGRTLEQMQGQIQNFLAQQRSQQAMQDFLAGLKKSADVEVMLSIPRTEMRVAENDPSMGPENAPITLVEFSDFQ